ncbi:MAG: magnesium/cobalt transporter CorA [Desulfobacterales bacterium]|nr:magnesium/cobalt transporter CorA [Desulfobacterales bacterium]
MLKFLKKTSKKAGLPPGALIHIGEKKTEQVKISVIDYDEEHILEKEIKDPQETFYLKAKPTLTWINVVGLHQVDIIETIGTHFNLHPLTIEDILNTNQRPKTEDFDDYLFVVLNMLYYNAEEGEVTSEQVSLILAPNLLISFQEVEGDVFDSVRNRIRKGKGRIRKAGSDYLGYALVDAIVDNYFLILETFAEKIEFLEDELLDHPNRQSLQTIHEMKRELLYLRKQVWPLREILSMLSKSDSDLIHESTGIYFRDIHDHSIQVIDTIESFRDLLTGMLDTYLSSLSNKMNEVMKVLTIIATIFIPVTFIAGVYGMNFKYMPELDWHWGYYAIWIIMLSIAVALLIFFKKKKWI